ncbi:hypothetical protein A2630_04715 [Candidatus Woesebacteria bacterium RIFCSPHIGHO2_01_FULL_44_10]|uniref:Ribbon-helix-helix protein CopG domain-containing protein n=1 Tax=Candidatus Woesebacteria bacterium RIFCSPLOWO2_01_FULL_44_14 TaxID=1802525 RepID=A0A1F8BZV7_9BACT|nr:MAG: hypothetical protein A2630_04715 [Candidatus Woesebacteria bacterium RIFCSPHIGHO2_01_FULL_44_10]OGM55846.1 MAG: hypothetical protein A3F62_05520 [Candidatus Woesebacteria bacterium RIFCSPHIGHO2_12_FULL_44_11]OGM69641.1 MAG: hypothetical protein A2975_00810 [Candidatus Woesebacteria bacterium RIFCSPLOWO2_01_FULL_44_14]
MAGNLNRVQVYLDPDNVELVDEMVSQIRINRSQVIRDLVSAVALNYGQTAVLLQRDKPEKSVLRQMRGAFKGRTTDLGLRVDEIYLS